MSSADRFPITEAQLTGNYCETLTYGMYLVTCCFVARTLLFTPGPEERLRKPSEIRWFMLSVAVILFIISTFDDIIGLVHNIAAFVEYTGPGGAKQELTNIHDWINISRSVAQVLNMIIGDFVLIYRCFIVYGRRWPVIIPSGILYLGGIAMALKLLVVEGSTSNSAITLNSSVIKPWWSAFFAITAVQNTLTTSLLVWRIWRVEHQNERFRGTRLRTVSMIPTHQPRLRKVIRVIAESGAAYTMMVFMTFVVSVCNSNALYPLSDATLQATGITFNVIIVRSSPRRDEQFSIFDTNDRAMAEQGQSPLRHFSSLHFISNGTSTQSGTINNVNIDLAMKSTSSRNEDDVNTEVYSVKDTTKE